VARTSGKGVEEVVGKASLSHCMLMTPPWPGNSRDCKTSAVWALFHAWPLRGVLVGRTTRTNHKRDMKWYNYGGNYSASQVTWKVMETDGTRLLYMRLEQRTSYGRGWPRSLHKPADLQPEYRINK
jgi:hypothetical protein